MLPVVAASVAAASVPLALHFAVAAAMAVVVATGVVMAVATEVDLVAVALVFHSSCRF